MATTEAKEKTITAELATPEAFAPFGECLYIQGDALPHVYGDTMEVYKVGFLDTDAPVEYIWTRYTSTRDMRVLFLERHHQMTQTFIPLGSPIVAIVAAPDCRLENGLPALEEVRAFYVPADRAVNLARGTWHEVPMPLEPGAVTLLTSHSGVTKGWAHLDETKEIAQLDEEKRNVTDRTGVVLRVEVPDALRAGG
jgi:ureidoglycolate lyase